MERTKLQEFMTNASVEMIYLPFEIVTGNVDFDKRISVEIPRHFDYFDQVYLAVDLPGFDEQSEYAWVPNVGFELIKSCELEVGGSQISLLTNEAMIIDNTLKHREMYDKCIGNVLQLTTPSRTKSSYRLNIPLQFDIPVMLAALQYHIVRVRIQLSPIEKLLVSNAPLPDLHLSNCKLLIKGVSFDSRYNPERNTDREYIVAQMLYYDMPLTKISSGPKPMFQSIFNDAWRPIEYLAWAYEYQDGLGKPVVDSVRVTIEYNDGFRIGDYETLDSKHYVAICDKAKRIKTMTFHTTFLENTKPVIIKLYVKVQNIFRNNGGMGGMAYVV